MTVSSSIQTEILKITAGLFNAAPGAAYLSSFADFVAANNNNTELLARTLANSAAFQTIIAGKTTAEAQAAVLMSNFGLTTGNAAGDAAQAYFVENLSKGMNIGTLVYHAQKFLSETTDSAWADAKALLTNKATVAEYYSVTLQKSSDNLATLQSVIGTVTKDAASVTTAKTAIDTNEATSTDNVLTTAQDLVTGTAGNDIFRAVAGATTGTQDQTTLNSSDIIDGGNGSDTLIVNMTGTGTYSGGARIKNIETLKIGTNLAAATFDYNINAGSNEVTEVTKIVADQINTGETLTVQNVLKTSGALPKLSWENDSNTAVAGTVNYTYRAAELTGTTDNQAVDLKSVTSGVLNLAAGIETVSLTSVGTERVTLNNSTNTDTTGTGTPYNNAADLVSNGTLTKVVLAGTAEIGKAAEIIATTGLTDRTVLSDTGSGATTQSNLLSVESRVTEVDASAATAAVNVRFVNKSDNSAQDVTFKGGSGNDYVEFELGNITATGNAGDDTFAFITTAAGTTNSTFGAGDNITGGEGSDTIQIGLNGAGTYTISATEFNNKTGIETLDLRGVSNTVTLSDAFVAGGSTTLTVRSDKIQQTSATSTANPTGSNAEENITTVLNLTELAQNRAINFVGGAGSDRLILDDASFNQYVTLAGGDHYTNGTATTGDFDTLTVVDSAVIDRTDLANVSGFEALVLSKNAASSQVRIELTQAFMIANTSATNNATKTAAKDDTIFTIATVAAGNGSALAAGDTVTIDVSDLLNAARTGVATAVAGRELDISSLTNAGVTVNYVVDGTTYTTAQVAAGAAGTTAGAILTTVNASTTTADGGLAEITGSAALASAITGVSYTSSAVGAQTYLGTNNNDTFTLSQADSIVAGSGVDTVTYNTGSAGAKVSLGAGDDVVTMNVDLEAGAGSVAGGTNSDTVTFTVAQFTGAINTTGVENIAFTTNAQTAAISVANDVTTVTSSVAIADLTLGTSGGTFTGTGTGAMKITGNTGADTITTADGADSITGAAGNDVMSAGAGNDSILASNGVDTVTTGTGTDTVGIDNGAADALGVVTSYTTITDFDTATDKLDVTGAASVFLNLTAATNVGTVTAGTVIEIASSFATTGASTDVGAGAGIETILANALGSCTLAADDDYTAIIYGGGNAYIYKVSAVATVNNADVAAANIDVDLIGVLNGVTADALSAANFQ